MGVLKAKVDGAWVEISPGVPPGGTTGQILTKTSAADYATAWTSTLPILANNTYLRGYKADGTTAQDLIGMTSADEISIGPSLAAGKNIYVPRLTVQGTLDLTNDQWLTAGGVAQVASWELASGQLHFAWNANAYFNGTAGNTTFWKDVLINGVLYKYGAAAYTHPDHVFEHEYTGTIERFRDSPGAADYEGLWPLDLVEEYAREHWRLPHHAPREDDRVDVFRRTHDLLAEAERTMLYLFDHERRLRALEAEREGRTPQ